jgi:molecular chaperone HscB
MDLNLSSDYFELFALPRGFDVNPSDLEQRYRELQRSLHPDRFAQATDQERRLSVQGAALVNEAYQTLKSPLLRAQYLLELKGAPLIDGQGGNMDPEFLMEQMELREALDEVRSSTDPLAAVDAIRADLRQRRLALEGEVQAALEAEELERAQDLVRRMQFFQRLEEQASDLEADLEDELL